MTTSNEKEEWFSIENIELIKNDDKLYCIEVDSPDHLFQIGEIGVPTHNTDEAKAADELKGEAQMIIGSIARLGRAAGVHLVVATQRPDASLIPGETRANMAVRIGCGTLKQSASQMLFESNVGMRTPSDPPGGIYVQIHGRGNRGQGFFAPPGWLDKYYEEHPEAKRPGDVKTEESEFTEIPTGTTPEEDNFNALEEWDDDMEAIFNESNNNDNNE